MKHQVHISPQNLTIEIPDGEILSESLNRLGIPLATYCHARGICGKCVVEIKSGNPAPPDALEKRLQSGRLLAPNHRLSCRLSVKNPLSIFIPDSSLVRNMPVLGASLKTAFPLMPAIAKYAFPSALIKGHDLKKTLKALFNSLEVVAAEGSEERVAAGLSRAANAGGVLTAVLHGETRLIAIEEGDTTGEIFGIAVDIGTTTVAMRLIDLSTGLSLCSDYGLNSQFQYGSDVVSRLTYAYQHPDGKDRLKTAIRDLLNTMIDSLLARSGTRRDFVYEIVVAGNTAMNHFFMGEKIDTLAVYPFEPSTFFFSQDSARTAGLNLDPHCRLFVVPNIRSFVGGDITAGVTALKLPELGGNRLLMDLGTNGEIVLKAGDKLLTTSTAAGPAFEGMNISCGMLARPGAICKVWLESGERKIETIGGEKPAGICGTGLLDLTVCLAEQGLIDGFGKIADPSRMIIVSEGIELQQKDLRQLQLAIAAVKAGVKALMRRAGLKTADLDAVYVAGAFGNYLDPGNAVKLGFLPPVDKNKLIYIGNSSLEGAAAILCSMPERLKLRRTVASIEHVSLSSDPGFQDLYIDALSFEPGFFD